MADDDHGAEYPAPHARTDRRPAGRSVEASPESLYMWQIAVLQRRVDALQGEIDRRERERQYVIDQYEAVLDRRDRTHRGELCTDGGRVMGVDADSLTERVLDRVRDLFA